MAKLTGDNAVNFEGYLLSHLTTALDTALKAPPWSTLLRKCGGLEITSDNDVANRWGKGKRPFLFLEVSSMEIDETASEGTGCTRWLVEVSIEAFIPPEAAAFERTIKAAILSILRAARGPLSALAIEESSIRSGQGRNANPERINPHVFRAAVHTSTA